MTKIEGKTASTPVKDILLSNPDGLREVVRAVMQEVLEAEMDEALGAGKGERTPERLGYRSGYYGRTLMTRVGKLELRLPQDRSGHFSTELFERYQRSERALVAHPGSLSRNARRSGGVTPPPLLISPRRDCLFTDLRQGWASALPDRCGSRLAPACPRLPSGERRRRNLRSPSQSRCATRRSGQDRRSRDCGPRSANAAPIAPLLVHADCAVHAIIDDEEDDANVVLHGRRQLLSVH